MVIEIGRKARRETVEIRALLADGLSAERGRTVRIAAIKRLDYWRSSHSFARLLVTLEGGEQLQVVAKRHQPGSKPHGNEREILIYRRLLSGRRFGAPALYGSVYDESHHRFLLLLEDVGDETLACADTAGWVRAVEGLGEMHGCFLGREDELRRLAGSPPDQRFEANSRSCLHEHDASYYWAIVEHASANLAAAGERDTRARFDAVLPRLGAVIRFLVDEPRTLVHGDLFPDNVIRDERGEVRPVDWESAAIGVGASDVVGLIEGWTGAEREQLLDAYLASLARTLAHRQPTVRPAAEAGKPVPTIGRQRFMKQVAHCQIIHWVSYLAWDTDYCRDVTTAGELLDLIEDHLGRLDGGRADG